MSAVLPVPTPFRTFLLAVVLLSAVASSYAESGGFCSAQQSLLGAAEDHLILGQRSSCSPGEQWLNVAKTMTVEEMLYGVHDGNHTSKDLWLQVISTEEETQAAEAQNRTQAKVTSSLPKSSAGRHVWLTNRTEAEILFQKKIARALVTPLLKFSVELGRSSVPRDIGEFLQQLVGKRQFAVMDALREVSGNRTLGRLLRQRGGIVRAVSQATRELFLLGDEISHRVHKLTSVRGGKPSPSSTSDDSRGASTIAVPAPLALGIITVIVLLPITLLGISLLSGLPAVFVLASLAYSTFLILWALFFGVSDSPILQQDGFDAGVLLGRTLEVVVGGFFRARLLRTALLYVLEHLASV